MGESVGWDRGRRLGCGRLAGEDREPDDEFGPVAQPLARDGDRAAVQLDQAMDERQADPQAALRPIQRLVRLDEEFEDVLLHLGRDPDARVADPQDGPVVLPGQADRDPAPRLGVLRGVVQQVGDDLLQAGRVALDRDRLATGSSRSAHGVAMR